VTSDAEAEPGEELPISESVSRDETGAAGSGGAGTRSSTCVGASSAY